MIHTRETVEEAFSLYAHNIPLTEISKRLKVGRDALYDWKKKYKWDERKKKITLIAEDISDITPAQIKSQQKREIREIIRKGMVKLKGKKAYIKPRDVIDAMKHELHLTGEAETSVEYKGGITLEVFKEAYKKMREKKAQKEK